MYTTFGKNNIFEANLNLTRIATLIFRGVNSFTDKKNFNNLVILNVLNEEHNYERKDVPRPLPFSWSAWVYRCKDFAGYFLNKEPWIKNRKGGTFSKSLFILEWWHYTIQFRPQVHFLPTYRAGKIKSVAL